MTRRLRYYSYSNFTAHYNTNKTCSRKSGTSLISDIDPAFIPFRTFEICNRSIYVCVKNAVKSVRRQYSNDWNYKRRLECVLLSVSGITNALDRSSHTIYFILFYNVNYAVVDSVIILVNRNN
jgi:hypothetical protein